MVLEICLKVEDEPRPRNRTLSNQTMLTTGNLDLWPSRSSTIRLLSIS